MLPLSAFFSAALLAVSFPTLSIWPLSFVAFAFVIQNLLVKDRSPRQMALYFGSFSFFCNLIGFYWLAYTIHEFAEMSWFVSVPIALLLFLVLALVSAAFAFIWQIIHLKVNSKNLYINLLFTIVFLVAWDTFDLRLFPWAPMMAVAANKYLLASVGVIDSWGWRVIFFLISALCFLIFNKEIKARVKLSSVSVAILLLLVAGYIGADHKAKLELEYAERQPVAVLQGNIGNYEKRQSESGVEPTVNNVLRIYKNLIEEAATVYSEVATSEDPLEPWYLWPETAFPGFPLRDRHMQNRLDSWVNFSRGLHLIGAYESGKMMFNGKEKSTEYNIALLLHEDVGYVDHYRKIVLMPYGEYFPGDQYIPKIYDWIPQINHFGRGEGPKLLAHPNPDGPVFLPVICYEVLFGDLLDEFLDLAKEKYPGREVIIYNPTNDSWFGKTVEPFMHARLARWQAARVSLPLLRVTNTGVSEVVAPWGELLATGPLFGKRVIYADLPVKKAQRRKTSD